MLAVFVTFFFNNIWKNNDIFTSVNLALLFSIQVYVFEYFILKIKILNIVVKIFKLNSMYNVRNINIRSFIF